MRGGGRVVFIHGIGTDIPGHEAPRERTRGSLGLAERESAWALDIPAPT